MPYGRAGATGSGGGCRGQMSATCRGRWPIGTDDNSRMPGEWDQHGTIATVSEQERAGARWFGTVFGTVVYRSVARERRHGASGAGGGEGL